MHRRPSAPSRRGWALRSSLRGRAREVNAARGREVGKPAPVPDNPDRGRVSGLVSGMRVRHLGRQRGDFAQVSAV